MGKFDMNEWQKKKYQRHIVLLDRETDKELIEKVQIEMKKFNTFNEWFKFKMKQF